MPSIRELFTDSEIENEGANPDLDFSLESLLSETDRALSESTRLRVPDVEQEPVGGDPAPDHTAEADPPASEIEPEVREAPSVEEPEREPVASTGAVPDPLGLLPPERQASLLAMDRLFVENPDKRHKVLQALADEPPVRAAEPTLPEDVDPDSFEATLWRQNVEMQKTLSGLAASNQQQQAAFAKQQAVTAADTAGANFEARYAGKLDHDDVLAIAQRAGTTGIAAKFASGAADLSQAFDQALEHVLWTDESFRAKALGGSAAPVVDKTATEGKERKRKLTALSSSASPTSGPPKPKESLETDVGRGRLSPGSRLKIVQEMATDLARSREGTF